jgi:hypothetical protein
VGGEEEEGEVRSYLPRVLSGQAVLPALVDLDLERVGPLQETDNTLVIKLLLNSLFSIFRIDRPFEIAKQSDRFLVDKREKLHHQHCA